MAEAMESAAAWQPDPYRSTGPASRAQAQVQCPARYVVVRPACVEGGSPGARGHTPPLSRAINARAAGHGPPVTVAPRWRAPAPPSPPPSLSPPPELASSSRSACLLVSS